VTDQFFHVSNLLYTEGDMVQANWGRVILGAGPAHNHFYREYLFERIRSAEFPDQPSRMSSAFGFVSHTVADWFSQLHEGTPNIIFEVEPVGPHGLFDMGWIDVLGLYRTFKGVEDCARRYWKGETRQPPHVEILCPEGLRIIKRITPIEENMAAPQEP